MTYALASKLRDLADEADREAKLQLEARDADYCAGEAAAFREAAKLVEAEADSGS